jgi:hypothetical protein
MDGMPSGPFVPLIYWDIPRPIEVLHSCHSVNCRCLVKVFTTDLDVIKLEKENIVSAFLLVPDVTV